MLHKNGIFMFVIVNLILMSFYILPTETIFSTSLFKIGISTDKLEYLTREPVFVRYDVKNMTDSSIGLALSDVNESFSILDESGRERVNNHLSVSYAFWPDTLKPRQTYMGAQRLQIAFKSERLENITATYSFGEASPMF